MQLATMACHHSASVTSKCRTILLILLISCQRLVDGRALFSSQTSASAAASDGEIESEGSTSLVNRELSVSSSATSSSGSTENDLLHLHFKANNSADNVNNDLNGEDDERARTDINQEDVGALLGQQSLVLPTASLPHHLLKNNNHNINTVALPATKRATSLEENLAGPAAESWASGRHHNRAVHVFSVEEGSGGRLRDDTTKDGKNLGDEEEENGVHAAAAEFDKTGRDKDRDSVLEQLGYTRLSQKRAKPVTDNAVSEPNSKIGILGLDNLDYTVTMLDMKRQRERDHRTKTGNGNARTSQRPGHSVRTGSSRNGGASRKGAASNVTVTQPRSPNGFTTTTVASEWNREKIVSLPSNGTERYIPGDGEEKEVVTTTGARQRERQHPPPNRTPVRPNGRVLPKTVNFAKLQELLRRLEYAG